MTVESIAMMLIAGLLALLTFVFVALCILALRDTWADYREGRRQLHDALERTQRDD